MKNEAPVSRSLEECWSVQGHCSEVPGEVPTCHFVHFLKESHKKTLNSPSVQFVQFPVGNSSATSLSSIAVAQILVANPQIGHS